MDGECTHKRSCQYNRKRDQIYLCISATACYTSAEKDWRLQETEHRRGRYTKACVWWRNWLALHLRSDFQNFLQVAPSSALSEVKEAVHIRIYNRFGRNRASTYTEVLMSIDEHSQLGAVSCRLIMVFHRKQPYYKCGRAAWFMRHWVCFVAYGADNYYQTCLCYSFEILGAYIVTQQPSVSTAVLLMLGT